MAALAPVINSWDFNNIYNNQDKFQIFEYVISENQNPQIPANDLLYYYKSDLVPGTELKDGKLNIQFNLAFSMIDIIVTLGTEYSKKDNPINEVIVGGSKIRATLDITNSKGVAYASTMGTNPETDIITTPGTFTMAQTDQEKSKAAYS